jgi:hypothetical protein
VIPIDPHSDIDGEDEQSDEERLGSDGADSKT